MRRAGVMFADADPWPVRATTCGVRLADPLQVRATRCAEPDDGVMLADADPWPEARDNMRSGPGVAQRSAAAAEAGDGDGAA